MTKLPTEEPYARTPPARKEKLGVKLVLIAGVLAVVLLLGHWYVDTHGPWGRAGASLQSANEFFGVYENLLYVTFFLSLGFPVVPWFFATPSRIWPITIFMLFILLLFVPLLDVACIISNCGQGAIALGLLALFWIGVGLLTLISAAIASFVKKRRTHAKPKGT